MMFIRFKKSSLLCLLAGLASFSGYAEEQHPIDKKTEACLEKNYSTNGMIGCSAQAEIEWDQELNKVYKALLSKLSSEGKNGLKMSQRQWLKYRDAEFEAIGAIYGAMDGTMWRVIAVGSRMEIVKKRVLTLKSYSDDLTLH